MRFVPIKGVEILKHKPNRNVLPFQIAVGQVSDKIDTTTRQVKVLKMELNTYLKMYFNKSFVFNAVDDFDATKKGDIVLVRRLHNPPAQTKLFGIEKILFKIDDIVDPITGKRVNEESEILAKYLEEISKSMDK